MVACGVVALRFESDLLFRLRRSSASGYAYDLAVLTVSILAVLRRTFTHIRVGRYLRVDSLLPFPIQTSHYALSFLSFMRSYRQGDHFPIIPLDPAHRSDRKGCMPILPRPPFEHARLGVEVGQVAKRVVVIPPVLLGDVVRVDMLREDFEDFAVGQDEHFGDDDRVEPPFDPAPHGGEEGGSADDLLLSGVLDAGWGKKCHDHGRLTKIRSRVSG